jgi:hypothetical protein
MIFLLESLPAVVFVVHHTFASYLSAVAAVQQAGSPAHPRRGRT